MLRLLVWPGLELTYLRLFLQILSQRVITRLRALVVLPTRDLVAQVREAVEILSRGTGLKVSWVPFFSCVVFSDVPFGSRELGLRWRVGTDGMALTLFVYLIYLLYLGIELLIPVPLTRSAQQRANTPSHKNRHS